MAEPASLSLAVDTALLAYDGLIALGEEIDDEWGYVNDLGSAWRERLEAVAASRPDEPLPPGRQAAIQQVIDEVGLITDSHRAIDWLSTFPQVVLLALGERP